MTSQEILTRSRQLSRIASTRHSRPVRGPVSEILQRWRQGEPADAQAILALHPEWLEDPETVVDLAYAEYCHRVEAGEALDADAFCERFPTIQATLRRTLEADQYFLGDPTLLGGAEPETLFDCVLLDELGQGAFATVFLATEPALGNRLVALKVSRVGTAEARTLGRLDHPNIVPVHWVRDDWKAGVTGICMPYVGSATLDSIHKYIFRSGFPTRAAAILEAAQDTARKDETPAERQAPDPVLEKSSYNDGILHLSAQLAEALAYAHAVGIYHGDLKPPNVVVSPDGKPRLVDFNLSYDVQVRDPLLGGTLPYMAPEVVRAILAKALDGPIPMNAACDVYSLGVMVYEMLTGRHPLGEINPDIPIEEARARLLERQRVGPPPLRRFNPRVKRPIAELIERCLAFNPAERPQSAAELARAFREPLAPRPRRQPWSARKKRAALVASLLAVVLLLAGTSAWAVLNPSPSRLFDQGVELQRQGDITGATKVFLKAEKKAERAKDGQLLAQIYSHLGYCASRSRNHALALEYYDKAIAAGAASAAVFNNRGYAYMQVKHRSGRDDWYRLAWDDVTKALELDPKLQAASHNRAVLIMERGKQLEQNLEKAVSDIEKALELAKESRTESAELFYHAACVYALADRDGERYTALVVKNLRLAIENGLEENWQKGVISLSDRLVTRIARDFQEKPPKPKQNLERKPAVRLVSP